MGYEGSVGIHPYIDPLTESLFSLFDILQGEVQREQGFAAADADALKPEPVNVIEIIGGIGEGEHIRGRDTDIILLRRTIKTAAVALPVDEQAGPGAVPAGLAARRKRGTVELGLFVTEACSSAESGKDTVSLTAGPV